MKEKNLEFECDTELCVTMEALNFLIKNSDKVESDYRKNAQFLIKVSDIIAGAEDDVCTKLLSISKESGKLYTLWSNRIYDSICVFQIVFNLKSKKPIEECETSVLF